MQNTIVFGATSGIGKQLAKFLTQDGYTVVITGRRQELLEDIKKQIRKPTLSSHLMFKILKKANRFFKTLLVN